MIPQANTFPCTGPELPIEQAEKIWLSSPHMGGSEETYVRNAFGSNWIAPAGPDIDAFERSIETCLGENVYACAVSSGTAAIHLALILLGVKAGDEVICQSFTFAASANPVVYLGATPVFVDSEKDTWNMDPDLLEEAIRDRTAKGKNVSAIIVVDLYGMPAKMNELCAVAARYNIPVVEDAAEALGSSLHERKCGTFADIAVLSFNGNKIITTSGGGAIISKNREWVQKAKYLSTQAKDNAPHYEHSEIGYNYRLSNISAAIGRGQMEVIAERVLRRRSNHIFYERELQRYEMVKFHSEPDGYYSNRWLTTIMIDGADPDGKTIVGQLRLCLERHNIETRPLWKPMHIQPVFRHTQFYGSGISVALFDRGLCLPSGSNLTQEQLLRVVNVIHQFLNT